MSVFEATSNAFHKHPALIIGAIVGIVAIGYVYSRSGGSAATAGSTTVQYSLGPSDAAVQAGAAIQIAQIQANATSAQTSAQYGALTSIAGINAGVATNASNNGVTEAQLADSVATSQQQYGYLATLSNNSLASHVSDNTTQLGLTQSNNQTELGVTQANDSASVQLQQANLNAQVSENGQNLNYDLNQQVVARNAALAGSEQSILANNNATYNSEIWSAIVSGQSPQTLQELQGAYNESVTAINAQVPTSGMWQAFAG